MKDECTKIASELISKVKSGAKSEDLKKELTSLPTEIKGLVFELFLTELYKGNGKFALHNGKRNDGGADLLIFHPKDPIVVQYIVQAKNQKSPLNYDDTIKEITKFEHKAKSEYLCNCFRIISVEGYVKEVEKLKNKYKTSLEDWSHVSSLIENYGLEKNFTPEIDLLPWNKQTLQRVSELKLTTNRIAIIQATGTGKSYLSAAILSQYHEKRKLLVAPSDYILSQFKNNFIFLNNKLETITYTGLNVKFKNKAPLGKFEIIIFDEFHRAGAEEWNKSVLELIKDNNKTFIIGTSATPIRYLDSNRDMAQELFSDNIAVDLSITDAISRKILPMPRYINALWSIETEVDEIASKLDKSNLGNKEKEEISFELKGKISNWRKAFGVSNILKKHTSHKNRKFIIFCKDKEHLKDMENLVDSWFFDLNRDIRRYHYRIMSGNKENEIELENFKKGDKNNFHLLFCIDMLNEGLHISDVDGVILLRPTESPNIYFQQIGRCMEAGSTQTPIIFDLVNNFKSIRCNDFKDELKKSIASENKARSDDGLPPIDIELTLFDETQEICNIFNEIELRLNSWDIQFHKLVEYKSIHGHCSVPITYEQDPTFARWVSTQRLNKDSLHISLKKKLDDLGFDWTPHDSAWEEMFEQLISYKSKHGDFEVPKESTEWPGLGTWIKKQRSLYNNGSLSKSRIDRLNALEFIWDTYEHFWNERYKELVIFYQEFKHCNVKRNYSTFPQLYTWINTQRSLFKDNKLPQDKIEKLKQIGFEFERHPSKWESKYAELLLFFKKFGHSNVPQAFKENPPLGSWVSTQRKSKSKLSQEQLQKLELVKFEWNPIDDKWSRMFNLLKIFSEENGNCNVPTGIREYAKLKKWIQHQRTKYRERLLTDAQVMMLNGIGLDLDPYNLRKK